MIDSAGTCAACGATTLDPHFRVSGELGSDGLIPTTKQFGTALSDIVRCAGCGHMQLERFPSEAELEREYSAAASDDYVDEEPGQRLSARAVLERVEHHRPVGRLLDVGCWVGFLMSEAEGRGWRATGIEPSNFASNRAREALGLDVRTAGLDDVEGEWDVVVLGDVLEHLTRANAALEKVASLTSPGGVLVLLLPDAGSRVARLLGKRWWSVIPTHVHYFTRKSIATMLEHNGYEVVEFGTDPKAFTVRYYLAKGGGYLPRVSRILISLAERLGLADRMWTPDFGDRMLVLARQPIEVVAEE